MSRRPDARADRPAPEAFPPAPAAPFGARLAGLGASGERVVWLGRPDGATIFLRRAPVWGLAAAGAGVLAALGFGAWGWRLAGVAAAVLLWNALERFCTLYAVTDRRLVRVAGVLRRSVREIPLARVQHAALERSLLERLLGLGSVGSASAGTDGYEVVFAGVSDPARLLTLVRQGLDAPLEDVPDHASPHARRRSTP